MDVLLPQKVAYRNDRSYAGYQSDPCRDRAGNNFHALQLGLLHNLLVEDDRTTHRTTNSGAADCNVVSVDYYDLLLRCRRSTTQTSQL